LLDIKVPYLKRVALNECPTWFYLIAHEDGEDFICLDRVFDHNLEKSPLFWIHGRFPELLGFISQRPLYRWIANPFAELEPNS
jgi:hypothetical protein